MRERIINYVEGLRIEDDEIKDRLIAMYQKEVDHIITMKKKADNLAKFSRVILGREVSSDDFYYKDEDELFEKAVNQVNMVFRKILG